MSTYEFQVRGADDQLHTYVGTTIPPDAGGVELALHIYALAGEPLGEALGGALAGLGGLGGLVEAYMTGGLRELANLSVSEVLGGVELPRVIATLAQGLTRLPPDVIMRLLAHTSRDGHPLRDRANFNTAYRANYIELAQAVAQVAQHNGFFTFGGTSSSAESAPGNTSPSS